MARRTVTPSKPAHRARSKSDSQPANTTDSSPPGARAVRDFLLQASEYEGWDLKDVQELLGIDAPEAEQAVASLEVMGYVERAPGTGRRWRNTSDGNRVAGVSSSPPIKRERVRKNLDAFLERVREVNASDRFLYRVERVILFGPFLTEGIDRIKNADVAVELEPKIGDPERQEEQEEARRRESDRAGKRFKSYADRRRFPKAEVREFLKGRSRAMALYDIEPWIETRPHRVLFQA